MRGIVALLAAAGCTTLDPMPSTTGVSAIPAEKPGGEVQLGAATYLAIGILATLGFGK